MKQNKIQIPEGYKNSALGIIPNDWEVKRLGEVCESISSGKNKIKSETGLFPVYGSTGIIGYCESFMYDTSAILVARVGANAGQINIANGKYDVSDNTLIIKNKNVYCFDFAYNQLVNYRLNKLVFGSGQPLITAGQLKSISIILPPLPQQQKIAEILGTWDEVIEKQSQLIDKLTDRKRGLMQQLLTGKKRLAGFSEEWKEYMIKNIASEVSNKNKNERESLVLSCTKYNGLVPSLEYFGRRIYADDISTYKIVPLNHFAYATNHIEEGSIGYQSDYEYAVLSPMYTVFKTTRIVNDSYLFSLLKTNNYILEYKKRMEGSIDRRGGLRWSEFSKIKIKLPSLPEQTAIANILTAANKEIELAKSKLELLRSQKSGLMQQLLTGKTRVKID